LRSDANRSIPPEFPGGLNGSNFSIRLTIPGGVKRKGSMYDFVCACRNPGRSKSEKAELQILMLDTSQRNALP